MNADAAHGLALERLERRWMRRAVVLARRFEGRTRPNPPVGAVVARDDRVLGEGAHRAAGLAHAEVEALASCAEDPRGATLVVTLEPCSTVGRTPPCTDRILEAGLRRVVVGSLDPNPRHRGRGIELLRAAGLDVAVGLEGPRTAALIEPFACWITRGRPWLALKLAASLDGAIADADGCSKWISGVHSRRRVQGLRRRADAVMVGVGTVLADDPSLLTRAAGAGDVQRRIVLDSRGRTPAQARILADGAAARTVLATTGACPAATLAMWRDAGAGVWVLPADPGGRIDLRALCLRAGREGWLNLLCEGGGVLAGALLDAGLVDELHLVLAPLLLGDPATRAVRGVRFGLDRAPRFRIVEHRRLGGDLWVVLRPGERPAGCGTVAPAGAGP